MLHYFPGEYPVFHKLPGGGLAEKPAENTSFQIMCGDLAGVFG
jgi:hypothetical protein